MVLNLTAVMVEYRTGLRSYTRKVLVEPARKPHKTIERAKNIVRRQMDVPVEITNAWTAVS